MVISKRKYFALSRKEKHLLTLTIFAVFAYEYSCKPANVTPDKWGEWTRNEAWKFALLECLAITAYLIIFVYCFGFTFCNIMARILCSTARIQNCDRSGNSYFSNVLGVVNIFIVLAYAFSPTRADTIPNNHLFYNKAGLRYLLPLLFVFMCIFYTAYYANRLKLLISLFAVGLLCSYIVSDKPSFESVSYNKSTVYCHAPVRKYFVRCHLVIKTLVESLPLLFTCKHTYDVSWMDSLPGKPRLLAYPSITKWGLDEEKSPSVQIFAEKIHEYSINLKSNISKIAEHEFVISRINAEPEIFVKIVRREDIKRRIPNNMDENLFIIFIDGASRAFAEVYLPKTIGLLQKWEKDLHLHYHTYLRYQHLPDRSRGNRTPFFVGYSYEYLRNAKEFSHPTFTKMLKNEGFISGYVGTSCDLGFWGPMPINASWLHGVPRKYYVDEYHHHLTICDPNFIDAKMPLRADKGPWAIGKHCIYGIQNCKIAGNYASSFFQKYNDQKKFMYIDLIEMHDGLGANLESLDEPMYETLKSVEAFTLNTTFVIHADHAHHTLFDKHFHLPYLTIIRPQHHQIPPQAQLNQQNLYTVYDLRSTLLDILSVKNHSEQEVQGLNLYTDRLPSRTCKQINVPHGICNCN